MRTDIPDFERTPSGEPGDGGAMPDRGPAPHPRPEDDEIAADSPEYAYSAADALNNRENLMLAFRADFGICISSPAPEFTISEMFDWLEEKGALKGGEKTAVPTGMDYQFLLKLKDIFGLFVSADSTIKKFALCHCLRGLLPFFGDFDLMNNARTDQPHTQKSFADWLCQLGNPDRKYVTLTRANVNKEVKEIFNKLTNDLGLALPLPEGMRKEDGCGEMSRVAIERLEKAAANKLKNKQGTK